jgi:hypothetical protein
METAHGKTHSENGEGECWWSRIASPYYRNDWLIFFNTFFHGVANISCHSRGAFTGDRFRRTREASTSAAQSEGCR